MQELIIIISTILTRVSYTVPDPNPIQPLSIQTPR